MNETCNNCKYLWDTGDCVSLCLFDDLPLNSDFLSVEVNCKDFAVHGNRIEFVG